MYGNWIISRCMMQLMPKLKINTDAHPLNSDKNKIWNIKEKVAVVTGGAGDIGVAIANELLKHDVKTVALLDLNKNEGMKVLDEIRATHGYDRVIFSHCDISSNQNLKDCLKIVSKNIGNIDIIVNAAGIWNELDWENAIQSNLCGVISTGIFSTNYMNRNGVILNIAGLKGLQPFSHSPILSASSSGVISASRCFGHKNNFTKFKIRFLCLCLGITKTKFLIEAEQKQLTPGMGQELQHYLKSAPMQTTDVLKVAALRMIKYAETGSVWVCEDAKLYSLDLPNWKCFANMEARFV
ncbi:15-hydroxyprostaglandin dehydrogenase [NAD(+)]-like isoform X2 [Aethina tumida]|uniref:15-hydroxyprostaglandin dehydrogenase [NAD(+)]-like isoform X2 n=1 Tax=Aethina tumida TaxID=116153 RepID=UPI0021477B9B|nr:15-hydroxyprostaglandin dehydrogenase [NAD(+)]-like isoform X2 [Aethina tumida]